MVKLSQFARENQLIYDAEESHIYRNILKDYYEIDRLSLSSDVTLNTN